MKYKILALCALSFSTPSLYSITTTNKRDIANVTQNGPAGIPAMCDNLRNSGALNNPVEVNSSSAGQKFKNAVWNLDQQTVTDVCIRGLAPRRAPAAAAAPPPAAPTDYEEMSHFLKRNTVNNPSLDLEELVASQGKSSVDYTHQEWINLGLFYDLLRTTAGLPKQPLRRKPARGKPAPGGGRAKPAVNMAALKLELKGAITVDPNVTDARLNRDFLHKTALTSAQKEEIEEFITIARWEVYITAELKEPGGALRTPESILGTHIAKGTPEYAQLLRFAREEKQRLHLPPVGRAPVAPERLIALENDVRYDAVNDPKATLDEILESLDLSRATLAESDYNRLKQAFDDAKGVMVDPAPVGGGGAPNPPPLPNFGSGGDPAPIGGGGDGGGGGYGGMVRPTPVANQNPGGRPEMPGGLLGQIQGYGGRGSLRNNNPDGGGGAPAAGGGGGDGGGGGMVRPTPVANQNPGGRPEIPGGLLGQIQGHGGRGSLRKNNPDGGDGAPAAGDGGGGDGGGGGYGGMVRPTPVANQNPGGRPEMPGGLLGQLQGHGGRRSLRKNNPDGGDGAPAAGDGGGAAAAGPVRFDPTSPMLGQPLTGPQKQNLIAEVERIFDTLPQGMPEEEAERIIEQNIRANNKWLTEANIETLRQMVKDAVVNDDDWG